MEGWIQTRTVGLPGGLDQQQTQRLDFEPHYVSAETIALLAQHDGFEPQLTEVRWTGVWHVDQPGDYTLRVPFRSGQVTLFVDGQEIGRSEDVVRNEALVEAVTGLAEGPHQIEIVQLLSNQTDWAGATISVSRSGEPVDMRVTPY